MEHFGLSVCSRDFQGCLVVLCSAHLMLRGSEGSAGWLTVYYIRLCSIDQQQLDHFGAVVECC